MKTENKDHLLELIHSMTSAEKGYFKKQSLSYHTEYIALFEKLNNLKDLHPKKLAQVYASFNKGKNISVAKQYLFDAILGSLVDFQASKNIETQLHYKIDAIKILYNKGLYNSCERALTKAKQIARDYQLYPQLLQLLAFEYTYNQFKLYDSTSLFEEERQTLLLLQKLNKNNEWYSKLMMWLQQNDKAKSTKELKEIEDLFNKNNGFEEEETVPFKAMNTLSAGATIYHYAKGNQKAAVDSKIKQLENYLSNHLLRESNYRNFLLVYGNALSLLYINKELERFEDLYLKFNKYINSRSPYTLLEKEIEFAHGLGLFKLKKDFVQGAQFIQHIREELESLESKFSIIRFTDMCFNACVILFWNKDLRGAHYWLNKIIHNPNIEARQYIYCYAKILELIIHMELGNIELLQSLSQSTFRYLYKRNKVHDFEKIMLEYLKKFLRIRSAQLQKELFYSLQIKLREISKDPIKYSAMEHFDYIHWLETKCVE